VRKSAVVHRVIRVMLQTRWSAEAWLVVRVEFQADNRAEIHRAETSAFALVWRRERAGADRQRWRAATSRCWRPAERRIRVWLFFKRLRRRSACRWRSCWN